MVLHRGGYTRSTNLGHDVPKSNRRFLHRVSVMREMSKLTTVGFMAPLDFPEEAYNKVHACLNKYKDTHRVQWELFSLGWNGLAYRYRALAEYDEQFTTSVNLSISPPPEERYKQGKAFFGFFVNAISVIDCFFFSTYCMASILKPDVFSLMESGDLNFSPKKVVSKFRAEFSHDSLLTKMKQCIKHSTYWKINDIRRVLIHRGMPPRKFYKGGERNGMATMPNNLPVPSDQWQYDLPIDERTTATYRQWLSGELKGLTSAADNFCERKL